MLWAQDTGQGLNQSKDAHASPEHKETAPLEEAIRSWHTVLDPKLVRMLHSSLNRLLTENQAGWSLTIATACSGTDIAVKTLQAILNFWEDEFQIQIPMAQVFSCERDVEKQLFLQAEFPECEAIFGDTAVLSQTRAPTVAGDVAIVKHASIYVAGFTCTSRSKLNVNRARNIGCVQKGEDKSGESFRTVAGYIDTSRPDVTLLENVVDMAQETESGESDASWIATWLEQRGYTVAWRVVRAQDHGSYATRNRIYWLACKKSTTSADVQYLFKAVLDSTRIEQIPLNRFLQPEPDRLYIPASRAPGQERDFKYKSEHLDLYTSWSLPWPPASGKFSKRLDHLGQRAYETVVFADFAFPLEGVGPEFLDCNMSLCRLVGPDGQTNPWTSSFPTLTSRGQYIIRENRDGFQIRQINGIELLQLAGWSSSFYRGEPPHHALATSLAGNMFSGFAVGPCLMAACAALGWGVKDAKDATEADSSEASPSPSCYDASDDNY